MKTEDMSIAELEKLQVQIEAELHSRWCDDCEASCGSRGAPTGCIELD
jgi:hypothetical protein